MNQVNIVFINYIFLTFFEVKFKLGWEHVRKNLGLKVQISKLYLHSEGEQQVKVMKWAVQ